MLRNAIPKAGGVKIVATVPRMRITSLANWSALPDSSNPLFSRFIKLQTQQSTTLTHCIDAANSYKGKGNRLRAPSDVEKVKEKHGIMQVKTALSPGASPKPAGTPKPLRHQMKASVDELAHLI